MIAFIFTGNVTEEPKMNAVKDIPVCDFTVALESSQKGKGKENATKFAKVSAWGKLGEICGKCVRKGAKVGVTCTDFDINAWQGKDGSIYTQLVIKAKDVEFLSSKVHEEAGRQAREEHEKANPPVDTSQQDFMNGFVEVESDDLPF
jgi:single-strand DNA-binding protein